MRVSVTKLDVALREPFRIATGEVTTANDVLVDVQQDGVNGLGESTPFEVITGGTQRSVLADLGRLPSDIEFTTAFDVRHTIAALGLDGAGPDSRHALDVALHDWAARRKRQPLATFLGGAPRPLPTSITLPLVPLEEMPRLVRAAMDQGFGIFKIKSKAGVETETKRIRLVRDVAGPTAELRVDANAGWSLAEARQMLPVLRRSDVRFLEQPLRRDDLAGHASLVKECSVPIMLDESIFTLEDARRVREARAADLFNVKLAKSGGISEAARILRFADAEGIDCMVGCMIQTRIATSADAHVAAGFRAVKFVDLDGHTFLRHDPVEDGVRIEKGRLVFSDHPGHGARYAQAGQRVAAVA